MSTATANPMKKGTNLRVGRLVLRRPLRGNMTNTSVAVPNPSTKAAPPRRNQSGRIFSNTEYGRVGKILAKHHGRYLAARSAPYTPSWAS